MVAPNKIRQNGVSARWSTDYVKAYAGQHKPTTVRVALAIHTLGGGILRVDRITAEAEVCKRTFNNAVAILKRDSLLEVKYWHDGSGKPVPSHYALQPVSGHKARSGDGQVLALRAGTCASNTKNYQDLDQKIEELLGSEDLEDFGIGFDSPSERVPPRGGALNQPEDVQEVEPGTEGNGGRTPGRRNILTANQYTFEHCKTVLADPDLEQQALDILELLDKLRVRDGHRPLTVGSRPSQLTSSRLLVAVDRFSAPETLDALRWAFSGQSGARKWARKIDKPFTLRQNYTGFIEAYRKALVADLTPSDPEPVAWRSPIEDFTPEQRADLARRLKTHR
ncbi:hypothetical protein [Mycolicibacterium vinylchloridicum]|uniref:hypothetical protein n=1 Tax=Mycolicibacterium vinylchloridicum TaxID=2736928 RepID=UPI0015CCF6B2|nr:hypothetical protein [Mycolicibacterium vinylchloridicum]